MKLTEKQLIQVNRQVNRILDSNSFLKEVYQKKGIKKINKQEDFEKLPFICKDDLRQAYPMGIKVVSDREVVRIHSSTGTTGIPVIIPYTAKDIKDWKNMFARCYNIAGLSCEDRVQITPGYGLWTAGIGFQSGCEEIGAMAIPMGPGNTEKQIQMMKDLGTTVITATSSYALVLAEEIQKKNIRDELKLQKGIFGSEHWGANMRKRIKEMLNIELYDIYGLTEIYGPGIGISCKNGLGIHYWDDYVYIEIINPITGMPVKDGEEGEIVITTLVKEAAPLIRFRTHDISRIIPGKCVCGCTYPRIDVIKGRSDDMFKVNGVNIFPSQIEEILQRVVGVSSEYLVTIFYDKKNSRNVLKLDIEVDVGVVFRNLENEIRKTIKSYIGITPVIHLVPIGTLPRSEKKSKRVLDLRNQ